jgi:hypothetical protein
MRHPRTCCIPRARACSKGSRGSWAGPGTLPSQCQTAALLVRCLAGPDASRVLESPRVLGVLKHTAVARREMHNGPLLEARAHFASGRTSGGDGERGDGAGAGALEFREPPLSDAALAKVVSLLGRPQGLGFWQCRDPAEGLRGGFTRRVYEERGGGFARIS